MRFEYLAAKWWQLKQLIKDAREEALKEYEKYLGSKEPDGLHN